MERFSRTERLIGPEKLNRLLASSAVLFGAGAVGSFTAEALVRTGIGTLTIIDFDVISVSNINRQLYALESTVGKQKTSVAIERLQDINPECILYEINRFADSKSIPEILSNPPDVVIDAIDSVGPKIELLAYCSQNNIPVFSSMGAARRLDPLSVSVGDLFTTSKCPLARLMRKALRKRGINSGITCVYSDELPDRTEYEASTESIISEPGPEKVLGSLPTVTGIFGLLLADTVIKFLTEKT